MNTRHTILPALWVALFLGLGRPTDAAAQQPINVPEGYVLVEGHVLMPEGWAQHQEPLGAINTSLWPDGVVPYLFDLGLSDFQRGVLLDVMDEWEAVSGVDFVVRFDEDDYISFSEDSDNCNVSISTGIGRIGGEQQVIVGCNHWENPFVLVHELGHVLGLWHEQSRADRDTYIDIQLENINDDDEDQFDIQSGATVYPKSDYAAFGVPAERIYDFASTMHYGDFNFCERDEDDNCLGTTITTLDPQWQDVIGQQDSLSYLDRLTMASMYPLPDRYFVDGTHGGDESGTFFEPYQQFSTGMDEAAADSRLLIQPSTYSATGTFSKVMRLQAPLGGVVIGAPEAAVAARRRLLPDDDGEATTAAREAEAVTAAEPAGEAPRQTEAQTEARTAAPPAVAAASNALAAPREVPAAFALAQNYPNPFNPTTRIAYSLPAAAAVHLAVYDLLGRAVAVLVDGRRPAGRHTVTWQAGDAPSGLYLYRLTAGTHTQTRTMVLLR